MELDLELDHFSRSPEVGGGATGTMATGASSSGSLTALNSVGITAESEAFRKCSADLIRAIQDPELLAWELYSDDVVSETVVDEVSVVGALWRAEEVEAT